MLIFPLVAVGTTDSVPENMSGACHTTVNGIVVPDCVPATVSCMVISYIPGYVITTHPVNV